MDKLTIIEIKLKHIHDIEKRANLEKEYSVLSKAASSIMPLVKTLYKELYKINEALWNIEDTIRDFERRKDFGERFIETARSVYFNNDKRAEIKKKINQKTGSNLIEEKSYEKY